MQVADRFDNRQILDNKIQYAIRSLQFIKLGFVLYIIVSNSTILAKYSPAWGTVNPTLIIIIIFRALQFT